MELLTAADADHMRLRGEATQRLTPPPMRTYDTLVPPPHHVVTEPAAALERLITPADYAGRHRKHESLLGRAWSRLRSWVGVR